jgi:PAS domain S-box-containing protein
VPERGLSDLLRAVFDTVDAGLILLDRERRVVAWNAWFEAASGVSARDAAGKRLAEVFPGAKLDRLDAAVSTALQSGTSRLLSHALHTELFPLRTRAGRDLIQDVTVNTVAGMHCLVQVINVTVAAERERVLRQRQNARYDAVVNSAPDVILTIDVEGTIRLANPAAARQFGYDAKDLVGRPASLLFESLAGWSATFGAVLRNEPVQQPVEVMARRHDGAATHLEISLSRWTSDGRVFVTAILRDVNERRAAEAIRAQAARALADMNATLEARVGERTAQLMEAEEALRQSQKMEAVGQLTGGIAHDFNNLLQGIIGALDRVQKRIAEGRIGDVERFLNGALDSANRAAALTHRLLAFSRRQPVDPRPVEIGELIATVEELLRRSIGESIDLRIRGEKNLWLVRCDGNQLENALLNLAINARDAMPDGGILTIAMRNATLDGAQARSRDLPPGDYVVLRIIDTGVGMPPEVRARAFDPFYTTKPIGKGTGLGLSMIYGFVRQSDGAVRIESEVGQGTTIEISLPRYLGGDARAKEEEERATGDRRAGKDEVVLVVEDEAVVRLLIVEVLNELGYRALEAADGDAALRILQSSQRIDLLVSDIGLPGLNGRQIADAARVKRPKLRVLFMTGYAENAAGSAFLDPGMEIITKPFKMDVMATKIREMLEGRVRA